MKVDLRKNGDVVIADLEGKLVRGTGDEVLRDVMNQLLGDGWSKILLNLSKVGSIDSSGIGELVGSSKLAKRVGASMKLLRLDEKVRSTLRLTLVLPLFEIFDDEDEAVRSFE